MGNFVLNRYYCINLNTLLGPRRSKSNIRGKLQMITKSTRLTADSTIHPLPNTVELEKKMEI